MNNHSYRICTRCIMDTSDPSITFNQKGECSHCQYFDSTIRPHWNPGSAGEKELVRVLEKIKAEGRGQRYDCVVGLSGGVDSSYVALLAKRYGMRPLVVHVDAGWNSELAVKNIENMVKKLNYDLFTEVIDWDEVRDLQIAYFKSGVANLDVPQDHAFFAALYSFAVKNNISYVLSGSNFATESVLPQSWGYDAMDARQLKAIHKKFGRIKLATYPTVGFFKYFLFYPYIKKMKVIKPLNYIDYDKDKAIQELSSAYDWRYYGGKHYESRFTRFFQGYILPTRFGFDKKRAHLSSLILAGQMSRETALDKMTSQEYSPALIQEDHDFLCKKLGFSAEEFDGYLKAPLKTFADYPSNHRYRNILFGLRQLFRKCRVALLSRG